jgi:hypothetical protein
MRGFSLAPALAIAVMSTAATDRAALARDQPIAFEVLRDGAPIGLHRVSFASAGDTLTVRIAIDLEVKVAFLTIYRYRHRSIESWRGGLLVGLETTTDDNGAVSTVRARATAGGLAVEGSGGSFLAPADTLPTSYWREDMARRSRLLDTQRGVLIDVASQRLDDPGRTGRTYRLTGGLDAEIGYGPAGDWRTLRFSARGADIEYTRQDDEPVVSADEGEPAD